MAKRAIKAGSTDQTIDVFIQNSSSTTGAGLTGLVYNSAGLTCYYRKGATGSATALTLATQTVGGAHSDGGFVEVDATNMPGVYRLDLSDTIVASAGMVTLLLKGATNMAPTPVELEIVSYDPFDSVRLGLTALPNAAASASGGLFTRGTGAGQIDQAVNGTINVNTTYFGGTAGTFASGRPEVNVSHWRGGAVPNNAITGVPVVDVFYLNSQADPVDIAAGFFGGYGTIGDIYMNSLSWSGAMTAIDMTKINNIASAGVIADAVWDEATSGHTTAGTFGKAITDIPTVTSELVHTTNVYAAYSLRQTTRMMAAVLIGKSDGFVLGTACSPTFYEGDSSTALVTCDLDTAGNRSGPDYTPGSV